MRFLVVESTGPAVANWLRGQGHTVFNVHDEARGIDDDAVIHKAFADNWILISNDKDFGEKIFREQRSHRGVVLLQLANERAANKIATLERLLLRYSDRLADNFVVVTESRVRFARK